MPAAVSAQLDLWGPWGAAESSAGGRRAAADVAVARLSACSPSLALDYFQLRTPTRRRQLLNADRRPTRSLPREGPPRRKGIASAAPTSCRPRRSSRPARGAAGRPRCPARAQLEHAIAVLLGKAPAEFSLATAALVGRRPSSPLAMPSTLLEPSRRRRRRAPRHVGERADRRRQARPISDRQPARSRVASRRRTSPTGSRGRAASGRSLAIQTVGTTAGCGVADQQARAPRDQATVAELPAKRAERIPGGRGTASRRCGCWRRGARAGVRGALSAAVPCR